MKKGVSRFMTSNEYIFNRSTCVAMYKEIEAIQDVSNTVIPLPEWTTRAIL